MVMVVMLMWVGKGFGGNVGVCVYDVLWFGSIADESIWCEPRKNSTERTNFGMVDTT